ncbi:MAG: hypothetical protein CMC82_02485 [Flavobacteriaceae bacterium]|nr:hypothetical protein [Flavobacteriaceae bacterium]
MKSRLPEELEIVRVRENNLQQDLAMLDNKKNRIEDERALVILKLVATREQIQAASKDKNE